MTRLQWRLLLIGALWAPATLLAGAADPVAGYTGAQAFNRYCASCHGPAGHGDGPVASSLKVEIPDLTELARRFGGKFPDERVREIIDGRAVLPAHGSRLMPVWGYEFEARTTNDGNVAPGPRGMAQELIDRLVDHLRSMQKP